MGKLISKLRGYARQIDIDGRASYQKQKEDITECELCNDKSGRLEVHHLDTSTKAEIIMTANVREWRHFFKLRTAKDAHPQMQEVANMALALIKDKVAVLFDDI